jgi:DNA-directed DNA polymerase III (polc)
MKTSDPQMTQMYADKKNPSVSNLRPSASSADKKRRPYAELRSASAFSFLDGASLPEDLIDHAAQKDIPAMALIDTNGVYGAPRFYGAAKKAGVRAIVGAEIVLDVLDKGTLNKGPTLTRMDAARSNARETRLTLLVENHTGYRNLCKLLTAGALDRPKAQARFSWDLIAQHAEGLHCITGGDEGPLAHALARGGVNEAEQSLHKISGIFKGRTHVELQRHHRRDEEHRNIALVDLARRFNLPIIATNGVRYARAEDKELHDILTCIREGRNVDSAGRLLGVNRERFIKGADEMAALFADLPEAIDGAWQLANTLDFTLANLGYQFPEYKVPDGESAMSFLRKIAWNGATTRFRPLTAKAQAQIEKELATIEKLDLAGYFLIVWDIVQFCQREKILVQGRGSAANSAVCYALGITAVDPVSMELLFERFLSEERGEWPDIDLDLPSGDQRERVIQHVYKTYGVYGAAMTANVITYRDRSSAREVGKALGFSLEQAGKLSKTLGTWNFGEIRERMESMPGELATAGFDPDDLRVQHFMRLQMQIQNLPRHLGQHSGGMVMAKGRLDEVVPLEPAAMPGRVVIQWDKDDCADLGIIKVDLLGLGMLAAIEEMVPLIRTNQGIDVDLAHLPQDDKRVYKMLNEADTVGMFQVESRAQMASLPRNAPAKFYDIVVQVAIIRPGPIVGGMVKPFFDRRQGKAPVEYPHPCLEPILRRTLGVPLFQEQLLRIAMVAADFTGGEAEELRRAMGFKRSMERMGEIEKRLRSGMTKNGIDGLAQDQIVKSITSFALYGFPESHAASFALIAYASAYLKAHHPAAFYIALLNAWPMGFYHPATLIKDAERHDVTVLPIDVNHSGWHCRWEHGAVRLGMKFVKGLRESAARAIEAAIGVIDDTTLNHRDPSPPRTGEKVPKADEGANLVEEGACIDTPHPHSPFASLRVRVSLSPRSRMGRGGLDNERGLPFASAGDLARRAMLRDDQLTKLAYAGALQSLGLKRRAALWQAAQAAKPAGELFDRRSDSPVRRSHSPLNEMSPGEETLADYAAMDLTTGPHLLSHFRSQLQRDGVFTAKQLTKLANGERVATAGAVIVRQRPGTAKGFVFLTLEDETGISQAIVKPDLFREHRALIVGSAGLIVEGVLQNEEGQCSVRAEKFWSLEGIGDIASHDFH